MRGARAIKGVLLSRKSALMQDEGSNKQETKHRPQQPHNVIYLKAELFLACFILM